MNKSIYNFKISRLNWILLSSLFFVFLSAYAQSSAIKANEVIATIDLENGNQYVFLSSKNKHGTVDDIIILQGEKSEMDLWSPYIRKT
ncbi:hypothetical protein [Microbulbifer sp. TYP-18]|uniref:hypothetical protein n=1 Tax=Microbulbifer sp. TYP-18 TaxID=3230024 RepID=UPI0034C6008A